MSTVHEQQYKPPRIDQQAFNCPHCGAFAHQPKFRVGISHINDRVEPKHFIEISSKISLMGKDPSFIKANSTNMTYTGMSNIHLSRCQSCSKFSIWIFDDLIWPSARNVPLPNPDLPEDVRLDYEEAGAILGSSPRGAAALLRLGIQKLCKHLGESGDNLSTDISSLVEKGLDIQIQKSLDSIRVIGNNAVHPSKLDLRDDQKTARSLFDLVNFIAESMISQPKKVSQIYENLPEESKKAIEKRDAR